MLSFHAQRKCLVETLCAQGYLKDPLVIRAFLHVPREEFMQKENRKYAYLNQPCPIGYGQTISQPLTVAVMTESLDVKPGQNILEVGTGSGYQAAILSSLVGAKGKVITTERIKELYTFARNRLSSYQNVSVILCDGSGGYNFKAPYDRIIVTANAPSIPELLVQQLTIGGKMVIPIGDSLYLVEKKDKNRVEKRFIGFYLFVPLVGAQGHKG